MVAVAAAIEGWMTEAELEWLHDRAAESRSVLEIGTWKGRSTAALAAGCAGNVITVDHFQGSPSERETYQAEVLTSDVFAEARANLLQFSNVTIVHMSSVDAERSLQGQLFSMIFIDGDHDEDAFRADLERWMPHASRLLCGHDRTLPGIAAVLAKMPNVEEGPDSIWWMAV